MKKLLGISLFAVLTATPLMASAADTAPVAIADAKAALAKSTQTPITTKGKYYAGETITDADKAAAASAAYVKGAYNAGISAVNRVAEDLDTHKADTTVHITAAERTKWNGKQDAITEQNKLSAGLVSGLATVATSGKSSDLNNDAGFITNAALTDYAKKQGVSASIDKAEAKGNISANVSGTVGGTLTSNVSTLKIGGGTISNTVTPTTANVPTTYSSNMMVNWGDTTPGSLATASGTQAVMTGVNVDSSLANATVTSGSITHTLTGLTVSGSATQNNVKFDVESKGYFDNASATPEYAPTNG